VSNFDVIYNPEPTSLAGSRFSKDTHYCRTKSKGQSLLCDNVFNSILVIGALHFVGAKLVSHFAASGMNVRALAGYEGVLLGEELVWYRDQQLRAHHGVSVAITNLSNSTELERLLKRDTPSDVVFVPPGVSGELPVSQLEDHVINTLMEQSLEELGILLEALRKVSPCTRIVLMSLSKYTSSALSEFGINSRIGVIHTWMITFELLVASYHESNRIPISIIRLNRLHGPWGRLALMMHHHNISASVMGREGYCWHVRDVVSLISQGLEEPEQCSVLDLEMCSGNSQPLLPTSEKRISDLETTLKWAESYVQGKHKHEDANVVFTSYFTNTDDFQRKRRYSPNHFQYMAEFFWSLKKHGLRAVVFHDGLDAGFQHRLSSDYPRLSFSLVESLHNRSTNDARFYAYYHYLREHPGIDRVLLTDISDVEFQKDPFQLMFFLGDWLYVGTDIDIFPNMKRMPWIEERLRGCFGDHSVDAGKLSKLLQMDTVYNAGTVGGSRAVVLNLLAVVVVYLDATPPSLNCNMPALNFVVHEHFFDKVFTGFPLNSRFFRFQSAPKGVYLLHK
jgi:nucleoside-diphosphate-sugar epimerase